jgi:eukaryotic-like serine/threonine-protein kinase
MKSIVGKIVSERYRILKELSHEDFSTVYLAEDISSPGNSKCKIERLQPQYNSEILGSQSWRNIQRLFVDQGNTLKKLSQHPQIPQLLACFEKDREFYLVREFVDGDSLEQILDEHLIDESEAIVWLQEILTILDFVHQAGVIHLNIKPSSLLQKRDGKIFLTNFGAIKNSVLFDYDEQTLLPQQAIIHEYFTPVEQQQGKANFTSDLYALGRTIIYALTGKFSSAIESQPLTSNDAEHDTTNISPKLAEILNKMTCDRTSERYQSAAEILAELDRKENVVTFPPPFFSNAIAPRTRPNHFNNQAIKTRPKIGQGIIWLLLILPFFSALAILFIGINKNVYKDFLTYSNENYQFAIKYPKDWSRRELDDPITGEVVVFSSPLESDSDLFLEKVNISVEYLSSNSTTLEEYTQIVFERINQEKGNEIEVYQDKKTKVDKYPARMVVYSRREGSLLLRQMEAFIIKDDRVYITIYTAERAKFSKFLDPAEKMIESWDIQE